jgi:hypothetical protein
MNARERFKAVVDFTPVDYAPIFGFPGAAGVSRSYWTSVRDRLTATGMPTHVGRSGQNEEDCASWNRYWGTTGPLNCNIDLRRGVHGFAEQRRIGAGFEIIESESGEITRQVVDNDNTYSMPEFVTYPVRDRASWEFYRRRMTPAGRMSSEEFGAACRGYEERDLPLVVNITGAYHHLRNLMGPEGLSLAFYDDPELIREMSVWHLGQTREFVFPLVERLQPEAITLSEDLCYNHGMLLSPVLFHEFCGPMYREVCDLAASCHVDLVAVDSDGNVMEYVPLAASCGIRGFYPFEVKAGNDLFSLRERHPDLVFFGWLEKELINEGNANRIEEEITSKVPLLLKKGRYFPNADHSLQPLATFKNLCRFMTILHQVCSNPEGEFPRA